MPTNPNNASAMRAGRDRSSADMIVPLPLGLARDRGRRRIFTFSRQSARPFRRSTSFISERPSSKSSVNSTGEEQRKLYDASARQVTAHDDGRGDDDAAGIRHDMA